MTELIIIGSGFGTSLTGIRLGNYLEKKGSRLKILRPGLFILGLVIVLTGWWLFNIYR